MRPWSLQLTRFSHCNWTQNQSLGQEDPLQKGMAIHCSVLAWRNPWTEDPGGLQVVGSQRVEYDWSVLAHTHVVLRHDMVCPIWYASVQFSLVAQSCPTLCDPMNCSTPGLPVHHQLPEFTQTQVHQVSDPIQPSHPLLSPSPPASNPSQHQSLFQWVNSSHEVTKVWEFQL